MFFACLVLLSVDGKVVRPKMTVKVDPQLLELSRSERDTEEIKHVHDFFLALAACNTIVPLIVEDKSDPTMKLMDYQGESPDEQALAYAAAAYGFMLVERTSGHIVIDIHGERQRYNFSIASLSPFFPSHFFAILCIVTVIILQPLH